MPINPDAVGSTSEPHETSWTSKDTLLYAVGIGAGADELAFTTENTAGLEQHVFPTYPVVIPGGGGAMRNIGTFNPAMLVHGEQRVTLHKPIPPEGSATVTSTIVGIYDKGKAAVVATETNAVDPGGDPLYTTYMSAFIRGEGGWGGDRGPGGARNVPPERAADDTVTYQTSPDQAFVYRLSGDRNPLHTDPQFAAMGGFDRPDPPRVVLLRLHRPGPPAQRGRRRPGPVPPHGGPVLVAGAPRRRTHDLDLAHRRRRGGLPHGQAGRHGGHRSGPGPLQLICAISAPASALREEFRRRRANSLTQPALRGAVRRGVSSSGFRPRSSS